MSDIFRINGFKDRFPSVGDSVSESAKRRRTYLTDSIPTGLSYLDDCFYGGIVKNDLVLLGAGTGVGKTQLAVSVAKNAASAGRKVVYFALEAHHGEIDERLIFSEMQNAHITIGQYMSGVTNYDVEQAEESAVNKLKELSNLHVFYKTKDFSITELTRWMLSFQSAVDLVILDHFHFIDHNNDKSELVAHKEAVKAIRDLSLSTGVPILLVAQLNKAHVKSGNFLPTHYDFYGTSDLPNICTRAVTLSVSLPEDLPVRQNPQFSPTAIYVSKNRKDGSASKFFGVCNFDTYSGLYEKRYRLFKTSSADFSASEIAPGNPESPPWQKNHRA